MALLDSLSQNLLSSSSVDVICEKTGLDSKQIKQVVSIGLPILIGAVVSNSKKAKDADSLSKALDDHAEKGTNKVKDVDEGDGQKIIKHILGSNTSEVTDTISKKTDISTKQVMSILAIAAPILMSLLGKQKKEAKSESSDLTSLLTSVIGGDKKSSDGLDSASLAGALLKDNDNDGKSDALSTLSALSKLIK